MNHWWHLWLAIFGSCISARLTNIPYLFFTLTQVLKGPSAVEGGTEQRTSVIFFVILFIQWSNGQMTHSQALVRPFYTACSMYKHKGAKVQKVQTQDREPILTQHYANNCYIHVRSMPVLRSLHIKNNARKCYKTYLTGIKHTTSIQSEHNMNMW